METYYRKRAPVYDRVYGYPERQQDLRYLQEVIPNRFAGRRVLEIAAGTGYWTQFIAKQAASVVATDLLPETLDRAKERPGLEGVEFRVMDAYRLNDIGGGYDGVFAGLWLSHVPLQRREPPRPRPASSRRGAHLDRPPGLPRRASQDPGADPALHPTRRVGRVFEERQATRWSSSCWRARSMRSAVVDVPTRLGRSTRPA